MDPRILMLLSGGASATLPAPTAISIDGRFFLRSGKTWRPLFASGLALCARSTAERQAFYRETVRLGFNGFRTFFGDLGWTTQTPAVARRMLPIILDEAADHGLTVYVCAITGGKDPVYDIAGHLAEVIAICAGRSNVLLEGANEIGHPTLSDTATVAWLLDRLRRWCPPGLLWTPGAPVGTDEPTPEGTWPAAGGLFNDAHLDRGREKLDQVRRLREIFAIAEVTGRPAMNGEMIGADERMGGDTGTKQRRNDPDFFFAAGALSRGFELGTVFHSQAGLNAVPLGPVQLQCARAFVAGHRALDTEDRLTFMNAGWAGSPVLSLEGRPLVRAYSFIHGDRGYTVPLGGAVGSVPFGNGWRAAGVIAEMGDVHVVRITR